MKINIWVRRIYLVLIVFIFLLVSTFLISLALGYKYSFSKHKFEKTSILYIKSYPKDATITLNSKNYSNSTPARITHLNPDLYDIKVSKADYQTWEKQFLVRPDESIFIEDISLFLQKPESEILKSGSFEELSISPDKEKLLFYDKDNDELSFFSISDNQIISVERNIGNIEKNIWSSDNQKILLKINESTDFLPVKYSSLNQNAEYFVSFTFLNSPILRLSDYIKFDIKECVWDKFDSSLLYITDSSLNLYSFNIDKKVLKLMNIKNVSAVKPEKSKIFYASQENGITNFYVFDIDKNQNEKIFSFENTNNYEFLLPHRDYFCLFDTDMKILYLIDPNLDKYLVKTFYGINSVDWDLYNRILLLKNDYEISYYDLETNEQSIVNRFSTKILDAFWHRNNNHIFYSLDNKLYVIEMDNRDKKNVFDLSSIKSSNIFLANKKGNILYHITPEGLIKETIQ
ncbi:MAG: PEGA domain-containing protein [Patescibacteria group bacterium]|nr:PEGA domain-containing protein [Patescibacteria group bacterium]MDD4304301.1 PEGA domain-containing protein [Patescibacteria group bacterium]MDD4695672.1 PEGA domain-containing protein [Patescibacteria group bacterium]